MSDLDSLGVLVVSSIEFQEQAACYQCKWQHGPSVNTVERAAKHATTRRHLVRLWTEHVREIAPDISLIAAQRRVIPISTERINDGSS